MGEPILKNGHTDIIGRVDTFAHMTKSRISLRLLSFGMAADIVGQRELSLHTQAESLGDLRGELVLQYPDLARLAALQLAVNQQYRADDYVLCHLDVVAIIPPVSGG